jgi:hypothetical protein
MVMARCEVHQKVGWTAAHMKEGWTAAHMNETYGCMRCMRGAETLLCSEHAMVHIVKVFSLQYKQET